MKSLAARCFVLVVFCSLAAQQRGRSGLLAAAPPVEFARDVLPILSANCFSCHGPDAEHRQADLRLDREADAQESGVLARDAGGHNELIARITSNDPDSVMPPPDFNRQLQPQQIETLRRWIEDGGQWQQHWAFEPIKRPADSQDRPVAALDNFLRQRLAKLGLELQPPASPHTLARRLSLDLLGVPPTPEQADAFAADQSPEAYEALVDHLLGQPQFGEHWARMWLDLARYADTKGYEKDRGRTMWPYRDWVIAAFNRDLPLDQFTMDQLAGDLLAEPTQAQLIATAFHRNTMSNDEGGTDDEEFRTLAVKDRINTTVQVWMGLTMGCAQCHTHKYDPISIEDYYRFYAIFNQTRDADRSDDAPKLEVSSEQQIAERRRLEAELASLQAELRQREQQAIDDELAAGSTWSAVRVRSAVSLGKATLTLDERKTIVVSGESPTHDTYHVDVELPAGRYTALRLEALPMLTAAGKHEVGRNPADPNFVVSELRVEAVAEQSSQPLSEESFALQRARADFSQSGWPAEAALDGDTKTGWAISPQRNQRHVLIAEFATPLELAEPQLLRVVIDQQYGNQLTLARFRLSTSGLDPQTLTPQTNLLAGEPLGEQIKSNEQALQAMNSAITQIPVMRELPVAEHRVTRVHKRGSFLDPGEVVEPAVLAAFHPLPDAAPLDRRGVAQWLVSPENPLTPRVWANRIWARLFGRGLVETEEDFGKLGSVPTHPQLLDLLADEYRAGGWSLKHLLKTIVMSDTYRQSSHADAVSLEKDPDNQWYSRAPRFRLTGEMLRDQALATAGLLADKLGGPPVMPPQPAGLWRSTYSGEQWVDAKGEDRFRRGIYTYLKRTTPYPAFTTFDGGSGEVCLIRRIQTNTPLQALITLNDPVFMEAAAGLAIRMLASTSDQANVDQEDSARQRAARGLRWALVRPVEQAEIEPLLRLQSDAESYFAANPELAEQLLATNCGELNGELNRRMPEAISLAEQAAWILVASTILNLDEYLTRN